MIFKMRSKIYFAQHIAFS